MIHQYDHRFGTFPVDNPIKLTKLPESSVQEHQNSSYTVYPLHYIRKTALSERCSEKFKYHWFCVIRSIANVVNDRNSIVSIVPWVGTGNSLYAIILEKSSINWYLYLISQFNSIIFDYVLKGKKIGANLNYFILKQLPTIPPDHYTPGYNTFIIPRVLELIYTAWDIKAFADDVWRDADDDNESHPPPAVGSEQDRDRRA